MQNLFLIRNNLVHGKKTVTTVGGSLFAGQSRLEGRIAMEVTNTSTHIVYYGGPGVTVETGSPIYSKGTKLFTFAPDYAVDIFFIAEAKTDVRVVEIR